MHKNHLHTRKEVDHVKAEEIMAKREAAMSDDIEALQDTFLLNLRKLIQPSFHTKNLKRENPYYSTLLNVVKIHWENFPARPPWNGVNFPASF